MPSLRDRPSRRHRSRQRRRLLLEQLEPRQLLAAASQNPGNPYDVTSDLSISPIDALVVINQLNGQSGTESTFYFDVNGDGVSSPIDALNIINLLNAPRPQVTFELTNDTDREGGSPRDRITYNLGVRGRISFTDQPTLYIGTGLGAAAEWIDASDHVDAKTGMFQIGDAALRELFAGRLAHGGVQLYFAPDQQGSSQQSLEVELLRAPPRLALEQVSLNEDEPITLDLMSNIYAPDSDAASLQIEILSEPEFGLLTAETAAYRYAPNENFSGSDQIVYEVSDGVDSSGPSTLALTVAPVNDPPVFASLADRTMNVADRRLEFPITVEDADGDMLDYVAFASVANPLAEIRETYGLASAGDDYFNLTGLNEKWLFGADSSAFLLLPNGDLVQWTGSYDATAVRESLVARLDESVYEDPSLLSDAPSERLAAVSVYVENGNAVLVAENGVYGEVMVTIVASDRESSDAGSFTLTIDPLDSERSLVDELLAQAASLTHEAIPGFVAEVNARLNSFSGSSAALLTDMLRQLSLVYNETESNLRASQEWGSEETRLRQLEIDKIESIEAELKILQAEYDAAWNALSERLGDAYEVDESLPPVFVNGTDYEETIQVRRGETVELDFRAIHPSHQPFYYFPDDFVYDESRYGFLKISPQTGLFTWYTPSNAAGKYQFAVVAEVNGNNTARIDFEIEIISNDPAIGSLSLSPTTITDKGSDTITLTANGVTHPSGRVDRVMFYQDTDGNGVFDEAKDRYLGRDEKGSDGWSWTGLPHAVEGASEVSFFAQAIYFTFSSANYSPAAVATAAVLETPQLDIDLLSVLGDEVKIGSQNYAESFRAVEHYGQGLGARVYTEFVAGQGVRMFLERLEQVNAAGVGQLVGERVEIADFGVENLNVQADAEGNLAIAFSIGTFAEGPEGFNGASLWLMRVDQQNKRIGELTKLASGENDGFAFAFAMNPDGEGIIAWKGYYSAPKIFLRTFSGSGADLHSVREIDVAGGFHDGGQWSSVDVNADGDYLLAWPDYAARGNVNEENAPRLIQTEYSPWYASISDNGWGVFARARELQAVDPSGRLAGKPITTTSDTSTRRRLLGAEFTSVNEIQMLWSKSVGNPVSSYDYFLRSFQLDVQSGLEAEAIFVKNESALKAGEPIEIEYSIANTGLAQSPPVDAAFYLSHDDEVTAADRLLGTLTTATGVAGESRGEFSASFTLPQNTDPFWNAGSTSLRLIMSLPAVGHQMSIAIPFVTTELVDDGGGGDGSGGSGGAGGGGGGANGSGPKYIRPDIAVDQIGYASVNRSLDLMELIGRQFVSAARSLAAQAPYQLADRIEAMAKDVEIRVDTFFLEAVTLREAREAAMQAAEATRDAAIASANTRAQSKIAAEQTRRDNTIDENQPFIDAENAKKDGKVAAERARINGKLQGARDELAGFENASSNADSSAGGGTFSLWGKPKWVEDTQKCLGDPVECGEKAADELSDQYKQARDAAKARLEPLIATLEDSLRNVESFVQQSINQVTAPFKKAISDAKTAYDKAKTSILAARDRLVNNAEDLYEETIANLPDLGEQIEQAKKSAIPALERAKDRLGAAIEAIRSPEGVLEIAKNELQSVEDFNPFGSVTAILEASSVTADIAQGVLTQIGEKLGPAVSELKQAGGEFSNWSKETGGQVSDWTKESAGDVAEWVKENVGDLLNEEIIAYKVTTDFDLSFNLLNGSFYVNAKIGPGLEYDSRKLKDLLDGQFAYPDIDPIEAALKMYGTDLVVTSNYDETRDQQFAEFGPQNVYFASERIVEYLGVESAAEIVAEAYLTGGAAVEDALKDLGEQLRLEMNDIWAWFELKGEQQLNAFVPALIKSLLTQTDFVTPHLELRWTPVTYRYELEPNPAIGKAIEAITGGEADLTDLIGDHELGVDSPHAAFAIIWKIPEAGDPLSAEAIDLAINAYLEDFDNKQLTGNSLSGDLLELAFVELEKQDVPDVVLDVISFMQGLLINNGDFEAELAARLRSELGIDIDLVLGALASGNPIVDLSGTPVGLRLASFLDIITFGNSGSAELDEMTLNLSTFTLNVSGSLCHKHSWGSISDIVGGLASAIG